MCIIKNMARTSLFLGVTFGLTSCFSDQNDDLDPAVFAPTHEGKDYQNRRGESEESNNNQGFKPSLPNLVPPRSLAPQDNAQANAEPTNPDNPAIEVSPQPKPAPAPNPAPTPTPNPAPLTPSKPEQKPGSNVNTPENPPVNFQCKKNKDCKDNKRCTTNVCVEGACVNTPRDCNDDNACTVDSCDEKKGCLNKGQENCTACLDATECDDKNACTNDNCKAGICAHSEIEDCKSCKRDEECSDEQACTTDSCKEGACVNVAIAGCK